MATTYTGVPTNVTTPHAATISSGTNATPVVITTLVPHLFGNGDTVRITGTGTGLDNGEYVITVTGAQVFSLNGTTASGVISTGTATDQSLTPQFQIPSDGDDFDVGSINPALQTIADRTQYLQKQNVNQDTEIATLTARTYVAQLLPGFFVGNNAGGGSTITSSGTIHYDLTTVTILAGDWIEVIVGTDAIYDVTTGLLSALYRFEFNATTFPVRQQVLRTFPGATAIVDTVPVTLTATNDLLSAGTYVVKLFIDLVINSGNSWSDIPGSGSNYSYTVKVWRNA